LLSGKLDDVFRQITTQYYAEHGVAVQS